MTPRRVGPVLAAALAIGTFAPASSGASGGAHLATRADLAALESRMRGGDEGSFTATYRVGRSGPAAGTLEVAQRAAAGHSAWPRGPGQWTYTLRRASGQVNQWVERAGVVTTCARKGPGTPITCSAPLAYHDANFFVIGATPFVPGSFLEQVRSLAARAPRSGPDPGVSLREVRLGRLSATCLSVGPVRSGPQSICVARSGRVVLASGASPLGGLAFPVVLTSWSSAVAGRPFALLGPRP